MADSYTKSADYQRTKCNYVPVLPSLMSKVLRQPEELIRKYIDDRKKQYPEKLKDLYYSNDKRTILKKYFHQPTSNEQMKDIKTDPTSHLPTKEDIELAESQLRKSVEEVIAIESVLDQLEKKFHEAGKRLHPDWRVITRRNIEIWFGCGKGNKANKIDNEQASDMRNLFIEMIKKMVEKDEGNIKRPPPSYTITVECHDIVDNF